MLKRQYKCRAYREETPTVPATHEESQINRVSFEASVARIVVVDEKVLPKDDGYL